MKPPALPPIEPRQQTLPIASVERETGLSKETLRVWERRYGFPKPQRDVSGERAYSLQDVDKLRLVKRLIDAGQRPGALVALPPDMLTAMCDAPRPQMTGEPEVDRCLDLLKAHELDLLRERLMLWERHEGLARFVTELVAPLNTRVGDAWMRGELQIFEEHAYAEIVQIQLRQALWKLPPGTTPGLPKVVLSTFPGEPHGLGLLMAEAMLRVAGADCISLGVQTPVWDLACAAAAYRCDVVALGFSGCMNPNHVVTGLTELRMKLPTTVCLWAGGSAPVLHRRRIDGVLPLASLRDIVRAVDEWRALSAPSAPSTPDTPGSPDTPDLPDTRASSPRDTAS